MKKTKRPSLKRVANSFSLPIQTAVLVPSTTKKSRAISATMFKKRVNITRRFLSRLFGGYTSVQGVGGYTSGKRLIREKVAVVSAYAQRRIFLKNKKAWLAWVRAKKREWGQESMGIIIENDLLYI